MFCKPGAITHEKAETLVRETLLAAGWIDAKQSAPPPGVKFTAITKWRNVTLEQMRTWGPDAVGGLELGKDILYWKPLREE